MLVRFDVPRVQFSDLRLRPGQGSGEILFDLTPLRALLQFNQVNPETALQLPTADLCQILLAWYLDFRSLGGECTQSALDAVRTLLSDDIVWEGRHQIELVPSSGKRSLWAVQVPQLDAQAPTGIIDRLVGFAGRLAGFERVPQPLPQPEYAALLRGRLKLRAA